VIVTTGLGLTVVVTDDEVAVHPLALVTTTENVPLLFTLMDWPVAPLLQSHELPADAVSVTLLLEQNVVGPLAVIVAAGFGFTVTVTGDEMPVQPPV